MSVSVSYYERNITIIVCINNVQRGFRGICEAVEFQFFVSLLSAFVLFTYRSSSSSMWHIMLVGQ